MSAADKLREKAAELRALNAKIFEARRFRSGQFDDSQVLRHSLLAEAYETVADALDANGEE